VLLRDEPVTYEEAVTPAPGHGAVVDREQTLQLGPRRAALQERTATGQGLHPEGSRYTIWFVDRGDHTLIGETHDVPGHDYAASQAVLARMLLSLELPEPDRLAFGSPETVDTAPSDGYGLGLVDVRTGRHDGFDRVVLELAGQGTVGWRVAYTDDPRYQGSGNPVDVEGSAVLHVLLDGLGYPGDRHRRAAPADRLKLSRGGAAGRPARAPADPRAPVRRRSRAAPGRRQVQPREAAWRGAHSPVRGPVPTPRRSQRSRRRPAASPAASGSCASW
jgi:hypothetical protein